MSAEDEQRQQAIRSIKRRRGLISHVVSFLVVNIIMVVIWLATGQGYFWPGWVMLGTGIILVLDFLNVRQRTGAISDEDIRREMAKHATA